METLSFNGLSVEKEEACFLLASLGNVNCLNYLNLKNILCPSAKCEPSCEMFPLYYYLELEHIVLNSYTMTDEAIEYLCSLGRKRLEFITLVCNENDLLHGNIHIENWCRIHEMCAHIKVLLDLSKSYKIYFNFCLNEKNVFIYEQEQKILFAPLTQRYRG